MRFQCTYLCKNRDNITVQVVVSLPYPSFDELKSEGNILPVDYIKRKMSKIISEMNLNIVDISLHVYSQSGNILAIHD